MRYKHVFVIGVDGAGSFFRETETPRLDEIFGNGAVSYDVLTSNPTISAQCWGSMLLGVTPEVHGLTNSIVGDIPYPVKDSPAPSAFRVIRENMPDVTLASFCNWNPINVGIIEEGLGVYKDTGDDASLTDKMCAWLEENEPTFFFVQFDGVDGAGHHYGYGTEGHLAQIRTTDGYIGRVYDVCKKRGFLDEGLFIVTADHGGFDHGHGGWTDGEKYVMFAAAGKTVEHGTIRDMEIRDTASVVLYALGLGDKQPEEWTSRVPSGLFKGVEAKERPAGAAPREIKPEYPWRTREPSPTPDGDASLPALIGPERVAAYLPFDGTIEDAAGKIATERGGKLYFVDGYFGGAARFDDGYVTLKGFDCGRKSFSVSFWMKCDDITGDPALFGNKNWASGYNPGLAVVLESGIAHFNASNGKRRYDVSFRLPRDWQTGWVHMICVLDREKGLVGASADFGPFAFKALPEELIEADFSTEFPFNLGQDGTGAYGVKLPVVLDDVLFVEGVLGDEDRDKIKAFYGI